MRHTKFHWLFRFAVPWLLGLAAVLLPTYGGYQLGLDLTSASFLCLIVVLLVSLGGYIMPAAWVSIVALLCLNYFFIPPLLSIGQPA